MTRSDREDPEDACRALIAMVQRPALRFLERHLLLDFLGKLSRVRPEARAFYLASFLRSTVPVGLRTLFAEIELEAPQHRPSVDVGIVTILREEVDAALAAFGVAHGTDESRNVRGLRFWALPPIDRGQRRPLHAVVMLVGEARTVPCAIACERLFSLYSVRACLLVGIAAGVKSRVQVGDVVAATQILDYEGQRLEPGGAKRRPLSYPVGLEMRRDLSSFSPRAAWISCFRECLESLAVGYDLPVDVKRDLEPSYQSGVVLVGEKLWADGSLPTMRDVYHDQVRAGEMEGSGFARSCEEHAIPWAVFRGVSDFGDPDKAAFEKWKPVAALSAATAARSFLEHEYRTPEERDRDLEF